MVSPDSSTNVRRRGEVILAVSVGCPSGIGPEVAVAAAASIGSGRGRIVLVGDRGAISAAAALRRIDLRTLPYVTVNATSDLPADARTPG
ncbi:MAG: hypothetical protein WCJ30_21035, partial [Deltaproteobacteria bacterium]